MFFPSCIGKTDKDPYLQSNNEEQEINNYGKISSKVIWKEKRTREEKLWAIVEQVGRKVLHTHKI